METELAWLHHTYSLRRAVLNSKEVTQEQITALEEEYQVIKNIYNIVSQSRCLVKKLDAEVWKSLFLNYSRPVDCLAFRLTCKAAYKIYVTVYQQLLKVHKSSLGVTHLIPFYGHISFKPKLIYESTCVTCPRCLKPHTIMACPLPCPNCRKRGHLARDCPGKKAPPQTCPRCGELGHYIKSCPLPCRQCHRTGHSERNCRK